MSKQFYKLFLLFGLIFVFVACQQAAPVVPDDVALLDEQPVVEIELEGPIAKARAEISGMAWCGDHLILLPQYPEMFNEDGSDHVFTIPKEDIKHYLNEENDQAIKPELVPLDAAGLEQSIPGFEGFESITFFNGLFFLTIEARQNEGMMGYLVKGRVEGDCDRLVLDGSKVADLEPQSDVGNISDETILVYNDIVYTIYEANGANVNPDPVAHGFDLSLSPLPDIPMATIEYRITDAAEPDTLGFVWAINYFFPGDTQLHPGLDGIAETYGLGCSHRDASQVERLVVLEIRPDGIVLADEPPIYLELTGDTSRNWEGIVRYEDGFLLVTDEYPTTILGYVTISGNLP